MKNEIKVVGPKSNEKNEFLKIFSLYVALVFLVILLFLPPMLRLLIKDKVEEKPKIILTVLNCSRDGELVVTAYRDSSPYNFYYSIKGNYTTIDFDDEKEKINDENENINTNNDDEENEIDEFNYQNIIMDILPYSSATYNEIEDKTEFSIDLSGETIQAIFPQYSKPIDEESTYYEGYGFTCTKTIVN